MLYINRIEKSEIICPYSFEMKDTLSPFLNTFHQHYLIFSDAVFTTVIESCKMVLRVGGSSGIIRVKRSVTALDSTSAADGGLTTSLISCCLLPPTVLLHPILPYPIPPIPIRFDMVSILIVMFI